MRPEQKRHLTLHVRDLRSRLVALVSEFVERGEPVSAFEGKLLLDVLDARLAFIESSLASEMSSAPRGPLGRLAQRLRAWTRPRIGVLRQHGPRTLSVPTSYLVGKAPEPAPVISIVTPAYGQGRFIERTMYSVLSQEYPALEYVVQDGRSPDGTPEILSRWEPHLFAWASEEDGGQADAINRGFGRTSGEIMGWLNSDDLLLPGSLTYVARYFAEHPGVDVVYGNRLLIDEEDRQVGCWILPRHDDEMLTAADYVPQETLFWRRNVWEAAGGYVDTSFSYALDWELLLRFREVGAVFARLPRFLGAFRVHHGQKTTRLDLVGLDEVTLLRRQTHGRHLPYDEVRKRLGPYYRRHIMAHTLGRIADRRPTARIAVRTYPPRSWPAKRQPQAPPVDLSARSALIARSKRS